MHVTLNRSLRMAAKGLPLWHCPQLWPVGLTEAFTQDTRRQVRLRWRMRHEYGAFTLRRVAVFDRRSCQRQAGGPDDFAMQPMP